MIEIIPLASSSAGNAYRITDGHTALLLEAGLKFRDIQLALNFQISELAGCLISHEHGDHCKSVADLAKAGVNIYGSEGTLNALPVPIHRRRLIKAMQQFTIGTWTILPFDVRHDVAEPLGYILANAEGEKLLFVTDTYYIPYRFTGLTHLMVECNYSMQILNENIMAGRVQEDMKKRLIRSHFSLENFKDFIRANDLAKVREIHLLHLSDTNSNEEQFKRAVQELTGNEVLIANR